jgi:hypothetical protein
LGYRTCRTSARRIWRRLPRKASTEPTGGEDPIEPSGPSGCEPTPNVVVLTDIRGGRTNGSRPDLAGLRPWRTHTGSVRSDHQRVFSLRTIGRSAEAIHTTTDSSAVGQWRPRRGVRLARRTPPRGNGLLLATPDFCHVPIHRDRFLEPHSSCWVRRRGDEPHGRASGSASIRVDRRANGSSPGRRSLWESARP